LSSRWSIRVSVPLCEPTPAAGEAAASRALSLIGAQPAGFAGLLIVALLLLCAVLADVIMPYDPLQIGAGQRMQAPSWSHPAGTDQLGRDVFSRVIKGSQIALVVSAVAIGLSLAIGILFGLIAGYGPRWIDNLLLLLFDSVYAIPTVMLGLAAVTLFGPCLALVVGVIVATHAPCYGRMVW
jgi:peptide/nickel transport system permease protein